ncbi:MAG: phosphate ABC transporter permease subunit PstC [Spirulinaceae cyanobacterium SM2_1_0]|nr:phosphate ABC transporter permease subunit PstC [Spirulinaceae cyanobacterium SM2_1_0]
MIDKPLERSVLPHTKLPARFWRKLGERLIVSVLFLAGLSSVATMAAIVLLLLWESLEFFRVVSFWEFITSTEWTPILSRDNPQYGILPLLSGTLVSAGVALLVSIPIGTVAAMYLSEFALPRVRDFIKPILEILAGVPTVVYGYFALLVVTPALQTILPDLGTFNLLSAGMVMGVMIVPFVSSISEDAMQAVPSNLREAAHASGSTRFQVAWRVVYPAAISGISSAYILAASRAVGETMIVSIAAGGLPQMVWNPMEQGATITAFIVQVAKGDLPRGTLEYQTIFAAGLTLIVITLALNIIGHFLAKRYREIY